MLEGRIEIEREHERFMTIDDLSKKMQVPKSWIYSRTRQSGSDAIPKFKVGKYLRFDWEAVKTWIREQNQQGVFRNE